MERKFEILPVVVFNGTGWEAGIVKSLLENAEIEAYLENEISGIMMPWQVAPGGMGPVKVTVSSEDFERAKIVVDEFNKNR